MRAEDDGGRDSIWLLVSTALRLRGFAGLATRNGSADGCWDTEGRG
jgi:hypothetical protein